MEFDQLTPTYGKCRVLNSSRINLVSKKIASILVTFALAGCGASQSNAPLTDRPYHHTENGFRNLHMEHPNKSFFSFLRMRYFSDVTWADHKSRASEVPIKQLDLGPLNKPSQNLQVSWLGHSTFLIQFDGLNIMTDPVFSERTSPFSFFGPKRYVPHVVEYQLLPKIDYVIISHNHYDHLDSTAVETLGNDPVYLVPLNLKPWFMALGINADRIREMDWWDKARYPKLEVQALPSQHWSARGLFDRHETLWASWLLKIGNKTIWFAGDTGYNAFQFREIGEISGGIDLALIPIGGYLPRSFMGPYHVNPAEAVKIHKDIKAKVSVGMHWGTFPLTAEGPGDPITDLKQQIKRQGLTDTEFRTMVMGDMIQFPSNPVK